jgi:hypothetical protein
MPTFEVAVLALLSAITGLLIMVFFVLVVIGEHLKDLKAYTMTMIDQLSAIARASRRWEFDRETAELTEAAKEGFNNKEKQKP